MSQVKKKATTLKTNNKFKSSNKKFNFFNFGNLYYYHPGENYFYFDYLLNSYERNPPNLAYLNMKHEIGHTAEQKINNIQLTTKKGAEELDFFESLEEILRILDNAIIYEQNNEFKYITEQYSKFETAFANDKSENVEKTRKLFLSFKQAINNVITSNDSNRVVDYDSLILLTNFFLQGKDNTDAILEFEKNRDEELNKRMLDIHSSYVSQISGLAKKKFGPDILNNPEAMKYIETLEQRRYSKIRMKYTKNPSLASHRGFSKLKGLQTADVKIGQWITKKINEVVENPKTIKRMKEVILEHFPDNMTAKELDYEKISRELRTYIIREITIYATKNIASILRDEMDDTKAEEIFDKISSDYSEILNFDITGWWDNFGVHGTELDFFQEDIKKITDGTATAKNLCDAARRFKQRITKNRNDGKKPNEKEKHVAKILHMHTSDNTDELSQIFQLLDQLEKAKNEAEKFSVEDLEIYDFLVKKGKRKTKNQEATEDVTIRLQITADGKIDLTDESKAALRDIQIGGKSFSEIFGNIKYGSIKGLIMGMKTKVSKGLRDTLTNAIKKDDMPASFIKEIEEGLSPITLSVSGPSSQEIREGIQQQLSKEGKITSSVWTGKLNVKNDFITVQVAAPLESFTINITGILSQVLLKKTEEVNNLFQTNYESINQNLASEIQSQMQAISKQKDFTNYDAMSKQFFDLNKKRNEYLEETNKYFEEIIKNISDIQDNTEETEKLIKEIQRKREEFVNQFQNSLYISSTMKTYNAYQNDVGFTGGSLGPTLSSQLQSIQQLFMKAGLEIPIETFNWIQLAVINCSPYSVVGEKHKDMLETFLGSLVIFSLFNEGGAELQLIKDNIEKAKQDSNMRIMHLYNLNGLYYPGSFVLKKVEDNIYQMINVLSNVTKNSTPNNITILNEMSPADLPNRENDTKQKKRNTQPWETVRRRAISSGDSGGKVSLKVVFMAGLVDIIKQLQKASNNIQLPD